MRAIELCAGAGGMSNALEAAGFDLVCAIDNEAAAVATAQAAGHLTRTADARTFDWTPFRGVTLAWASVPCQCWSMSGKRLGAKDPRNGWPWALRMLDEVEPTWFGAENVPGLVQHSKKAHAAFSAEERAMHCARCYFDEVILVELQARFAVVQWAILDAADFGVPQHRRRVILIAGPKAVPWPDATHGPGLQPFETVRQALGLDEGTVMQGHGNPETTIGGGGNAMIMESGQRTGPPGARRLHTTSVDAPAPTLRDGHRTGPRLAVVGAGSHRSEGYYPRELTDEPCSTITTLPGGQVSGCGPEVVLLEGEIPPKTRMKDLPLVRCRLLDPGPQAPSILLAGAEPERLDRPSPAVLATEYKGARHMGRATASRTPARASDALWRATGRRRLTPDECAVLQDFPAGYPFQGTKTAIYQQIGNAVPFRLGLVVARAIATVELARAFHAGLGLEDRLLNA